MRIMLDTNVLISALLFPGSKIDAKDYPVLYTAIIENVDILVTGDKDFSDIDIDKPEIMTPTEFTEKFL